MITSSAQQLLQSLQEPQGIPGLLMEHTGTVVLPRLAPPPASPGEPHPHTSFLPPPSSSWEPPNAQYWAQFHGVRPQGPESRQQQHKHNQRVLGYCVLIMLAGMGLHYVAFR